MKIDNKDKKILALLRINSRMAIQKIAEEVNLSRSAVDKRIQNMINEKVITGFTVSTCFDEKKSTEIHSYLLVKAGKVKCQKIFDLLKCYHYHFELESIYGEFDCMIKVANSRLPVLYEMKELIKSINGIEMVYILPVLDIKS
ncbi:Lrp/AsnC family transcriptional regulator [Photobacterium rosenbergii]|uniref:Lrp/AsnC family transcriptional regulator n=1 Tax=Photobacterium rosenbergii TaxID=294936 RepID=A0ABU3ZHT6_9GAMM|nr:Lrp/AsnC family transcriptional regulator [Photobacterium rosenbergii]MDV5169706.1 Lrp/AsnC family transcriptional regulator [Photobacterium rosenbergii]